MRKLLITLLFGLALAAFGAAVAEMPSKRPPDVKRGKEIYHTSCWQCHGVRGASDGPAAANLRCAIPDLRSGFPDSEMDNKVDLVREGREVMPAFAVMYDKYDTKRVLKYILTFSGRSFHDDE